MDPIMVGLGGDAPMMLGVLWGLTFVTFLFVLLRLYTRIKVVEAYGWDDHFFNASFVTLLVYDVMMTVSSFYGFGRDMTEIVELKGEVDGMQAITNAILYSAIGQTILVVGTALSKTSLALFLLRLVTARSHKIAIWVPDIFLATAVVASLFVFWLSCQPREYLWDRRLDGECTIDPGPISVYAGSWSVIIDFWYAAFPWYLLWKIQMHKREKLLIAGSMSLGVFAGACGIKRAIELRHLGSPNYLKDIVGIIIWHAAELCCTMVCIGIPVCMPLYKTWIVRFTSTGNSGSKGTGPSGKPSQGSAGVFGLQTIGGSEYQNNNGGLSRATDRSTAGYQGLTDEDITLRKDIHSSQQREVVVKTGHPVVVGRSTDDDASDESILGDDFRQATGDPPKGEIRVQSEFRINGP